MNTVKKAIALRHLIAVVSALLLVAWFAWSFNHGERIQHNNGLGWDGAAYADWAQRDTQEILSTRLVSEYYIGRLLPSIVIHHLSQWLHYDIASTARVIHAFYMFNVALLAVAALLLWRIARHYQWRPEITFLAFSGFYANYPVLTNMSYNPTLTDMSGYVLGLAVFYSYIKDRLWLLAALCFLSCFVWPTMMYGALPLIMLGKAPLAQRGLRAHGHCLALAAGAGLLGFAAYLYQFEGLRQSPGTTQFVDAVLPLSAVLFVLYIYLALRPLIDVPSYLKASFKVSPLNVGVGILLYVIVKAILNHYSGPAESPLTITSYLGLFTQASVSNPLINVVAHAMHYGPLYLLAIFLWPRVVSCAKQEGLGMAVFVMLFAFLSIGSESRQFLNAWPTFLILTCLALSRMGPQYRIDWWFSYAVAGIGIVLSRFWLPINVGPWTGNFQAFPDQMLYMYSGPWISHQMYPVFLAVTVLTGVALLGLVRKIPTPTAHNDQGATQQ